MFSSNKDDWETPQWLFDELNLEFNFTLDAAATEKNKKCDRYLSDAMNQTWAGNVWCNPPYGRTATGDFINRGYEQFQHESSCRSVVFLVPARTDTSWFHTYCYYDDIESPEPPEIRFLKGRLKFEVNGVPCKNAAPFPSMLVIFK